MLFLAASRLALAQPGAAPSADACGERVTVATRAGRSQSVSACEFREPHDFVDQEAEVAAGIVRFMRGGSY